LVRNSHGNFEAFPIFRRVWSGDDLTLGALDDPKLQHRRFALPFRGTPVVGYLSTFNVRCLRDATYPRTPDTDEFVSELQSLLPDSVNEHAAVERRGVGIFKEKGRFVYYSQVISPIAQAELNALTQPYASELSPRETRSVRSTRIIWGESGRYADSIK